MLGFVLAMLVHHRSFVFRGFIVCVGSRCPEGVVGQADVYESETGQEDGRKFYGMDHLVTDDRDFLNVQVFCC